MSKKTLQTVIVILLLVVALFTIVKYTVNRNRTMVSPGAKQTVNEQIPKEIKYDSSTDLKKELDSVDPLVSESDFKDL